MVQNYFAYMFCKYTDNYQSAMTAAMKSLLTAPP